MRKTLGLNQKSYQKLLLEFLLKSAPGILLDCLICGLIAQLLFDIFSDQTWELVLIHDV